MKNAQEMNAVSKVNYEKALGAKLAYVEERIDNAARQGGYAVKFMNKDYRMESDVKDALRSLGYDIHEFSDQREPESASVTVSWATPRADKTEAKNYSSSASQFTNYEQTR